MAFSAVDLTVAIRKKVTLLNIFRSHVKMLLFYVIFVALTMVFGVLNGLFYVDSALYDEPGPQDTAWTQSGTADPTTIVMHILLYASILLTPLVLYFFHRNRVRETLIISASGLNLLVSSIIRASIYIILPLAFITAAMLSIYQNSSQNPLRAIYKPLVLEYFTPFLGITPSDDTGIMLIAFLVAALTAIGAVFAGSWAYQTIIVLDFLRYRSSARGGNISRFLKRIPYGPGTLSVNGLSAKMKSAVQAMNIDLLRKVFLTTLVKSFYLILKIATSAIIQFLAFFTFVGSAVETDGDVQKIKDIPLFDIAAFSVGFVIMAILTGWWISGTIHDYYKKIIAYLNEARARARSVAPSALPGASPDEAPPHLLLLRSFLDDQADLAHAAQVWRDEEKLVSRDFMSMVAATAGAGQPVIATGNIYDLRDPYRTGIIEPGMESWQGEIGDLMTRTATIAAIYGKTVGLKWEMDEIVSRGAARKLVLIFPPWQNRHQVSVRTVSPWLADAIGLPEGREELRLLQNAVLLFHSQAEDRYIILKSDVLDRDAYVECLRFAAQYDRLGPEPA